VTDVTGQLSGNYALKRIKNDTRWHRFKNEVEAIKQFSHENIIPLIDHSRLDVADLSSLFLVMPIAEGGTLAAHDRLQLYKGDIHAVIGVARQIALALSEAHSRSIVHRDIKPKNILFKNKSHDLWVADFGLCLIPRADRKTEVGEVVGPVRFTAPELESGGPLDVTRAADIYSLGKLIYYIFSGGVTIPREAIDDSRSDEVFGSGERQLRLRILLEQMICERSKRLQSISEVIARLDAIADWERKALEVPLGDEGTAALVSIRRRARDATKRESQKISEFEYRTQIINRIKDSFTVWIKGKLQALVEHVVVPDEIKCAVGPLSMSELWTAEIDSARCYVSIAGFEFRAVFANENFATPHRLQIRLCQNVSSVGIYGYRSKNPMEFDGTLQCAIIPFYQQTSLIDSSIDVRGFLTKRKYISTLRGKIDRSFKVPSLPVQRIMPTFHTEMSAHTVFDAGDWIAASETLEAGLREAVDLFFGAVEHGTLRSIPM